MCPIQWAYNCCTGCCRWTSVLHVYRCHTGEKWQIAKWSGIKLVRKSVARLRHRDLSKQHRLHVQLRRKKRFLWAALQCPYVFMHYIHSVTYTKYHTWIYTYTCKLTHICMHVHANSQPFVHVVHSDVTCIHVFCDIVPVAHSDVTLCPCLCDTIHVVKSDMTLCPCWYDLFPCFCDTVHVVHSDVSLCQCWCDALSMFLWHCPCCTQWYVIVSMLMWHCVHVYVTLAILYRMIWHCVHVDITLCPCLCDIIHVVHSDVSLCPCWCDTVSMFMWHYPCCTQMLWHCPYCRKWCEIMSVLQLETIKWLSRNEVAWRSNQTQRSITASRSTMTMKMRGSLLVLFWPCSLSRPSIWQLTARYVSVALTFVMPPAIMDSSFSILGKLRRMMC